jgi:hypothetical protein
VEVTWELLVEVLMVVEVVMLRMATEKKAVPMSLSGVPLTWTVYMPGEAVGSTVKDPTTLPFKIEQVGGGVAAINGVEGEEIAHVVSGVSNPVPVTPIVVPAGPDH